MIGRLDGMRVAVSDALTRTEFRPNQIDRFVEYEPKDEGWMTMLGMGRRVEIVTDAFRVGGVLYMSPATWHALQRHLTREGGKP